MNPGCFPHLGMLSLKDGHLLTCSLPPNDCTARPLLTHLSGSAASANQQVTAVLQPGL